MDLILGPGDTHVVDRGHMDQVFDLIRLGDDSVINFEDDVDHWTVTAKRVYFGERVSINAGGRAGEWRDPAPDGKGTRTPGRYGQIGGRGQNGGRGRNGITLDWHMVIEEVGGVVVDTSGGNGGRGGDGGNGGRSGDARCSDRTKARNGQQGGRAGDGGDGGNGGNIHVTFSYGAALADHAGANFIPGISFTSEAGEGGDPGIPGRGGAGGSGANCLGPDMGGGSRGPTGGKGVPGTAGFQGVIVVDEQAIDVLQEGVKFRGEPTVFE